MNRQILVVILSLLILSCYQRVSIKGTELRQVLQDVLSQDSSNMKFYLIDSIMEFNTKSITNSNITYYIADCEAIDGKTWPKGLLDSAIVISPEQLNSISKPGKPMEHYSLSLPYFSRDRQSFLIYYYHFCGNLCMVDSLDLYKKAGGKWILSKVLSRIVS